MIDIEKLSALRVGLIIFLLAIVTGILAFKFSPGNYKISTQNIVDHHLFNEVVSPYDFYKLLNEEDNEILIIDIREEDKFSTNNFQGSVNIPVEKILKKRHLRKLKSHNNFIISDNEWETHFVAMLLLQLGINATPVNSDFYFINENLIEDFNHDKLFFSNEKRAYDYHRFIPADDAVEVEEVKLDIEGLGGC